MDFQKKGAEANEAPEVNAESLVSEIKTKLNELKSLQGLEPEDQKQLDSVCQGFESFAASMNQEPNQEKPKAKPTGRVSLMAGAKDTKPVGY